MTITSTVNKVAYTANGTSKNFTVPFYFIYNTDLKVYRQIGNIQELLILDTDYTVTGMAESTNNTIFKDGGTIVMNTMPAAGTRLIIFREVPLTQETDYQEGSTFPAILHELALDKLTMIAQQLKEKSDRAVTVDIFSEADPSELVNEIEALYGVKEEVITAADNIDSIVTAAENIEAIVDAPDQAAAAAQSATLAHQSEANALSYRDDTRDHATRADGSAMSASNSANLAQTWATGNIDVRPEGSAKYWAELAEQKAGLNTIRTNCIISVPQLNLTITNGNIKLKAGNKVYFPNSNTFDEYTLPSDISGSQVGSSSNIFYYLNPTKTAMLSASLYSIYSGSTPPDGTTYAVWYDTANNRIGVRATGSSTFTFGCSLPVCICTIADGAVTSIDQVFSGFGYIGNTIFALPNVKGLIPNGRNADGSLKNTEFETTNVLTHTVTSGYNGYIVLNSTTLSGWNINNSGYDFENNINEYNGTKYDIAIVGTFSTDSTGHITAFNPKLPFQAVDASDYRSLAGIDADIDYIIESARNGASWYAKYRSGRLEQGGNIASQTPVVFLKPFKNTNYSIVLGQSGSNQSGIVGRTTWNDKTTTGFTPSFVTETDWFATGEGA